MSSYEQRVLGTVVTFATVATLAQQIPLAGHSAYWLTEDWVSYWMMKVGL